MTEMQLRYARWVAETDSCSHCTASCSQCAQRYLINENINVSGNTKTIPLPVVPQGGYLGPEYESQSHKFLVLGKNPSGNDLKLFDILFPQKIAYANQILCRTTKPASQITKDCQHEIYDSCFEHRIKQLIEILSPQTVVTLGEEWGSWLDQALKKVGSTKIHVLALPFPSHGRELDAHEKLQEYISKTKP